MGHSSTEVLDMTVDYVDTDINGARQEKHAGERKINRYSLLYSGCHLIVDPRWDSWVAAAVAWRLHLLALRPNWGCFRFAMPVHAETPPVEELCLAVYWVPLHHFPWELCCTS